jgi:hypothetical protein
MAQLGKPIPGFEFNIETWREDDKMQRQRLDELFATGKVVQWGRGDGYAMYYVESERPLILRHIPYGDAWTVELAFIRGLRLRDIKDNLQHHAALRAIFGERKST